LNKDLGLFSLPLASKPISYIIYLTAAPHFLLGGASYRFTRALTSARAFQPSGSVTRQLVSIQLVEYTIFIAFFMRKVLFITNLFRKKQTVNRKLYKEMIKRLIARVRRVMPEFQESGSCYFLHDDAAAHSSGVVSEFLAKQEIPF
jgi:hypothetical protein